MAEQQGAGGQRLLVHYGDATCGRLNRRVVGFHDGTELARKSKPAVLDVRRGDLCLTINR